MMRHLLLLGALGTLGLFSVSCSSSGYVSTSGSVGVSSNYSSWGSYYPSRVYNSPRYSPYYGNTRYRAGMHVPRGTLARRGRF